MAKEKHLIQVVNREELGSAASRRARKEGMVPAVVDGHGAEPKSFLITVKDWDIIAKQDVQIVQLKPNKGSEINVLIKDVQYDYLKNRTDHIDFLEVKMDEAITASIPVHTIGTPAGITQGGTLEHILHEVEVNCTPLTLPEYIEVNIENVELNGEIKTGDLPLPEGVTIAGDTTQTVLHVIHSHVSEEGEEGEDAAETPEAPAAKEGEAKSSE
jgi:large subunit ribosomal protein L25